MYGCSSFSGLSSTCKRQSSDAHQINFQKWRLGQRTDDILVHGFPGLDVTKTRNGEWGMGNGEWGMGNEEWGRGNEEWGMGNGEWGMRNSGQR